MFLRRIVPAALAFALSTAFLSAAPRNPFEGELNAIKRAEKKIEKAKSEKSKASAENDIKEQKTRIAMRLKDFTSGLEKDKKEIAFKIAKLKKQLDEVNSSIARYKAFSEGKNPDEKKDTQAADSKNAKKSGDDKDKADAGVSQNKDKKDKDSKSERRTKRSKRGKSE